MSEIEIFINITRLIVGVVVLSYASYTDIKTRKASNKLWILIIFFGIVLLLTQILTVGFINLFYLFFIPIMIIFVYMLFQIRLIFGGADAKAIMSLAILVPIEPSLYIFPLFNSIMPFSWIIFSNSILLFLFLPLSLLIYNIFKKNIEIPYCFLGYRMKIDDVKDKFVWPLEKIVNGKRKLSYMPKNFSIEQELKIFKNKNINEIWVTPKVPFMIPLLVGFICSFIFGDILFYLMQIVI